MDPTQVWSTDFLPRAVTLAVPQKADATQHAQVRCCTYCEATTECESTDCKDATEAGTIEGRTAFTLYSGDCIELLKLWIRSATFCCTFWSSGRPS